MIYIDGKWVAAASGSEFEVTNPATGESLGTVPAGGAEDARAAIAAATAAFAQWSATTAYERAGFLRRAYDLFVDHREHLAQTMTAEQGKPLKMARNEVQYGADFLLWFSEEAKRVYGETIPAPRADQRFIVLRQPLGVVAAVTPWNYPVSMLTRKLAPALAAGCTAVLKPAEATPLCAVEVFKLLEEAGLPPGVANLVTAEDPVPVGEEFVGNPDVAKLTFTGSTAVGRQLAAAASAQMKRVSMELGGHAPFVVFDDADPVHAAKGAALVKFLNTGQACICPNRIFVQRGIHEEFVATLGERVARLRAGDGTEDGVSVGPLVGQAALDKVTRQVEDAVSRGADIVCGGSRLTDEGLDRGFFYAPTVLDSVTADMLIYREETFGPVAPVIPFDDDDEVIAMANDTNYGLASYVYTRDLGRAWRAMEQLRFGIVGVNDINPTAAAAPFGGMADSGIGREGGHDGIAEYLETKLVGLSV